MECISLNFSLCVHHFQCIEARLQLLYSTATWPFRQTCTEPRLISNAASISFCRLVLKYYMHSEITQINMLQKVFFEEISLWISCSKWVIFGDLSYHWSLLGCEIYLLLLSNSILVSLCYKDMCFFLDISCVSQFCPHASNKVWCSVDQVLILFHLIHLYFIYGTECNMSA